ATNFTADPAVQGAIGSAVVESFAQMGVQGLSKDNVTKVVLTAVQGVSGAASLLYGQSQPMPVVVASMDSGNAPGGNAGGRGGAGVEQEQAG
ncbi:unnamed protein product, partial [Amoebophrya sp. A25]